MRIDTRRERIHIIAGALFVTFSFLFYIHLRAGNSEGAQDVLCELKGGGEGHIISQGFRNQGLRENIIRSS